MTISAASLQLVAAQLPVLARTLNGEVGAIAQASSTIQLVGRIDDVLGFHAGSLHRAAAAAYECYGFLLGFRGYERPAPFYPVGAPTMQTPAEAFLEGIRSGAIGTLGVLTGQALAEADQFQAGALKVFQTPSAPPPPFLQSVSRGWGRLAATRREGGITAPSTSSEEMGRAVAGLLLTLYNVGLAGGLSPARLSISLHVRDIPGTLGARGWLAGFVEALHRKGDEEPAQILDSNLASIITYTLNSGEIDYVTRAAEAVTDPDRFRRSLSESIEAIGRDDPATGGLLRSRKKMVTSKLLHSGALTVTTETLQNLKGWREN